MGRKKKNIDFESNRYGLFMTDESYKLEMMYGRHYLKTDIKHEILLYKINIIQSKSNDLYGQSKPKDKSYFAPVQLTGFIRIDDPQQSTYGDESGVVRDDSGNLTFNVYLDELEEKGVNFDRGDIIEYNMGGDFARYYEVFNANNVVDTTSNSIGGFRPYYKKVEALPVKEDLTHLLNV
jgi:hypothetical protein